MVRKFGEQPLAEFIHESSEEFGRQIRFVVGEQRSLDPFDHGFARLEEMRVDLKPDVLFPESQVMQERGISFRRQDGVAGSRVRQIRLKGKFAPELARDPVRRIILVGRDLDEELAFGLEGRVHSAQDPRMVVAPLECGVGQDHVVFFSA